MEGSRKICFVTGNANKLRELSETLASRGVQNVELTSHATDLPELQGSVEDIVTHKALQAQLKVGGTVLIEDTCLEFRALGGMPGPYIKWFLDAVGCQGLTKMLEGFQDKRAAAICTLTLCSPLPTGLGVEMIMFQGRCEGTVVAPKGEARFGWDPIFAPNEGDGKTFAEMEASEKNKISHRAKATEKLIAYLRDQVGGEVFHYRF